MEETVNQRIRTLLKINGLSVTAFCKELALPQTTINKQINGDSKISLDTIKSFLTYFPRISADWLINGVGDMYSEPKCSTEAKSEIEKIRNARLVQVAHGDNNNQNIANADTLQREVEFLKQRIADKDEEIKFLRNLIAKQ